MLADFLDEVLLEIGHEVCGIAITVDDAVVKLQREQPDIAILDMRLGRSALGTDIANRLGDSRGLGRTGILYLTGQPDWVHREARFGQACLTKPYMPDALGSALAIVAELVQSGVTSRPLPRGMELLAAYVATASNPV